MAELVSLHVDRVEVGGLRMKHTVKVQQLMSDDNAYLNVIEDCGYVGVWTYPHDDGGVFVRLARTRDGQVALLAFGSLATAEEFEQNTVWTFVDIPEMDAECMENMRSSKIAREGGSNEQVN